MDMEILDDFEVENYDILPSSEFSIDNEMLSQMNSSNDSENEFEENGTAHNSVISNLRKSRFKAIKKVITRTIFFRQPHY